MNQKIITFGKALAVLALVLFSINCSGELVPQAVDLPAEEITGTLPESKPEGEKESPTVNPAAPEEEGPSAADLNRHVLAGVLNLTAFAAMEDSGRFCDDTYKEGYVWSAEKQILEVGECEKNGYAMKGSVQILPSLSEEGEMLQLDGFRLEGPLGPMELSGKVVINPETDSSERIVFFVNVQYLDLDLDTVRVREFFTIQVDQVDQAWVSSGGMTAKTLDHQYTCQFEGWDVAKAYGLGTEAMTASLDKFCELQ